jgi:predicted  nucleic acid-binding Zn-ribbon protein
LGVSCNNQLATVLVEAVRDQSEGACTMQEQLAARLQTLRQELETGQKMLADLDVRRAELQQTILRISGAIQVLEELLVDAEAPAADGDAPREAPAGDRLVQADA